MVRKLKRVNIFIDMTPMVDVVMLLLTFFMLTTHFKPPAEVDVILPFSHSVFKVPESNVMTVTVSKDNRIFFGLDNQILREKLFGAENMLKAGIEVSMETLPNFLIQARILNPRLLLVLKGDKEAPYGAVEDIIEIFQKSRITRFNFITELEKTL